MPIPKTKASWWMVVIMGAFACWIADTLDVTAADMDDDSHRRVAPQINGLAHVVDGDSLIVGDAKVRLYGLDAPEWSQTCDRDGKAWAAGREATAWLRSKIEGKAVVCASQDQDRYGRAVAVCYLDGEDLNAAIVRAGWAIAYRRYSARYVPEEQAAKAGGLGIWAANCNAPEDWRRDHPRKEGSK